MGKDTKKISSKKVVAAEINQAIEKLELLTPSKKTRKKLRQAVSSINSDLKKQRKKAAKEGLKLEKKAMKEVKKTLEASAA